MYLKKAFMWYILPPIISSISTLLNTDSIEKLLLQNTIIDVLFNVLIISKI